MPPPSLYPPTQPQSISEVLNSGFTIFHTTLGRSIPYGLAAVVAAQLPNLRGLGAARTLSPLARGGPAWWTWYASGMLVSMLISSALVLRQSALAAGRRASLATELRTMLARLADLIALALFALIALTLGLALLVVPGVYLAVPLCLAVPALLLRPLGPLAALICCARLVRGHWWRTALILAITGLVMISIYALCAMLTAFAISALGIRDLERVAAISAAVGIAAGALAVPFFWAMMLATFAELSVRHAPGA